jgi:uncharacterized membrane protein YkoI
VPPNRGTRAVVAAIVGGCLLLAAGGVTAAAILRGSDSTGQAYQPVVIPGSTASGQADGSEGSGGEADSGGQAGQGGQVGQNGQTGQTDQAAEPRTGGSRQDNWSAPQPSGPRPYVTRPDGTGAILMTESQAKEIALARVPGATSIRLRLEYDDGRHVYEGEIIHGNIEYEFELDAMTGEFLEWDEDWEHD